MYMEVSMRTWQLKSLVAALLLLGIGQSAAPARADCANPPDDPYPEDSFKPLPTAVQDLIAEVSPGFAANFDILVYWAVSESDGEREWAAYPWPVRGDEGILAFVEKVMPAEVPGDDMYERSIMWRVCEYFSLDRSEQYGAVPFDVYWRTNNGPIDLRTTHYYITIRQGGDSYSGHSSWVEGCYYGSIELALPQVAPVYADLMATNGFAHEWEHVIANSMRWGVDLGAGESLVSGMGGVDPVSRTLCYTGSERSPRCHGPVPTTHPSSNMSW